MKKLISALAAFAVLGMILVFPCSAATEYATSITSIEDLENGVSTGMAVWSACKLPVKFEANTKNKFDGKHSLKIYCTNNAAPEGSEWHSNFYWDTNAISKSDWTGAQYLEFWIKNDTGVNFGLQIQFTENDKNNQPLGEPWRIKTKTEVFYEDNGAFVKQTSDVTDPAQYNEFAQSTEGAVAIPKGFAGRIRVAINTNNFRRAEWFAPRPGDGSNNVIDKSNIGQLSFGWDPRIVESNATWYLDSIRLVAPNANLKGSVPYDTLTKQINGGGSSTTSSATPSKVESKVTSTSSKVESTPNDNTSTSTGSIESNASSQITSEVSESSISENSESKITESQDTVDVPKEEKDGLSVGATIAIVSACIVILGGGIGIVLVMNKEKIFKKK